jgi:acetyltransferase-like isoleucine patch superfamily enzyme
MGKNDRMGQIPLEDEFHGLRALRSVFHRILHSMARILPMFPSWRTGIHRARGVRVGRNVFIGSDVFIDNTYPESIVIEDFVTIISRTFIIGHSFTPCHLEKALIKESNKKRGVILRKGCYIGAQCIIMPGVSIGECAIVGAGSVVTEDIQPYTIVMGAPARKTRDLSADEIEAIKESLEG